MNRLGHDLSLLVTNLSQLKSKDQIIKLFIDCIDSVFPDYKFTWDSVNEKTSKYKIEVCTRLKTFGFISFNKGLNEESESFTLVQNLSQLVAVLLEKTEQEELLADKELKLRNLLHEKGLEVNQAKYRTIFESTGTATLIVEEDTTISMANHECFSLTGYSQAELIGQKWTKYVETESLQNMIRNHNLRRENPLLAPKKYEVKLIHKNGEARHAILDIGMVPGTGQSVVSILDITDRIIAEQVLNAKADELRISEELFKNVFEFASVGKSLTSLDGKVNANKAFYQLLGYTKKEMKNINWRKLTYPDDILKNDEITKSILRGDKKSARWEKRYLKKNGEIIWVDISTTLLRDRNGEPIHFITTIIDITEKKRSEEKIIQLNSELEKRVMVRTSQLEEANKELQAFAYSVSHDLRAPLRAIDGFSKFVLEDYSSKLDSEGQRFLGLIRSNTKKMDKLITDILALSRITRSEHKKSKVDMTKMALSMFNEAASPEIQKRMKFVLGELPKSSADPIYIKQVWINLISNAIKFSSQKKKPEIKIDGYVEKGFNVYYIKDNGVGFNPEYSLKLFGVFQRLHKADEFEGTGVGLAIVQRIIHRHGGSVWANGKEGKGATFYFSLPANKVGGK
jgi:PAS domain S-box-containing protein